LTDENGKVLRQFNILLAGNESHTEEVTTDDLAFGAYFFYFVDLADGSGHIVKWVHY
jgi:hypothetical protein